MSIFEREIEVSLFTTEEAAILERGNLRLFGGTTVTTVVDPLALPINDFQCAHVSVDYEQKEGAAKGTTVPVYTRCNNSVPYIVDEVSHEDIPQGFLCSYHDRVLLTKRLSKDELKIIHDKLATDAQDSVVGGIIQTDAREIKRFPIKRLNSLRVHMSPQVPALKGSDGNDRVIIVHPEWEKVGANG